MANGVYANGGIDNDGNESAVDSVLGGPIIITKTGDSPIGDMDANTLSAGDSFTITGSPDTFAYVGSDGSGGILAVNFTSGNFENLWLTDTALSGGELWPALVEVNTAICFAAGTLIATPEGECAVERLEIGDLVTCADGRTVPVKWIGRQTVHKLFTPAERFTPVRVRAGALGDGLPHTDLVLTADHALILDGLAINAGALVNGTSIAWEPMDSLPERVTYYHVETEDHDVILANGAAAETYVDYVQRRVFDNHAEYLDLYGEERTIREMALPRISTARLVPPMLRKRLAGRDAA
ncbi:Hint domain-containing protein [Cribrihabitans sp. XS_ASV171]